MTTYTLPACNWSSALAKALGDSVDGDVIVCASESAMEWGERAKARFCPDKKITFALESEAELKQ